MHRMRYTLYSQCGVNSIYIANTQIKKFAYRDSSVVESFQVQVFRSEGLAILATSDCYTILKPKIRLKHTFNYNLRLKTIYQIFILKIQAIEADIELCKRNPDSSHAPLAPYHYASHYSNSGVVLHYLVRLLPYTQMFLKYQGEYNSGELLTVIGYTFHMWFTPLLL